MGGKVEIFISVEEWRAVTTFLFPTMSFDESVSTGHVELICAGQRRTWVATDTYQLAVLEREGPAPRCGDAELSSFEVLVNPRLFRHLVPADAVLIVSEESDGDQWLTLDVDGVRSCLPAHPGPFASWRPVVDGLADGACRATIETHALRQACAPTMAVPAGHAEVAHLSATITVGDGGLQCAVSWENLPPTLVAAPVLKHDGTAATDIDPHRLWSLIREIEDDRVELILPADPLSAIAVRAGDYLGVLKPLDPLGGTRRRLEGLLGEFLGSDPPARDVDGDYPLRSPHSGVELYVRLDHPTLPTVQVFSVLARSVPGSEDLYRELNAINASTPHVKVLHADDAVMAEIELVGETLDLAELANAVNRVDQTTARYRALLEAFFGETVSE